jgi:hypothetical protein
MMKAWEVFKESLPLYVCASDKASFIKRNDIIVAKSGTNNYACNFAIIENENIETQKEVIKKDFKCNGLIFAPEHFNIKINKWSEDLGFEYYGRVPVMNKKQEPVQASIKYYDNIRIERVLDSQILKDFIGVFSETRGMSFDEGKSMFPHSIFSSTYFLYVAYYLDAPAGIFVAINTPLGAIVADADVKEQYRNSNVLKILSERALFDVVNNKIYNYSVIPTSQFSYNVVMQYGFNIEGFCHVWQKLKGGELNV